MRYILNPFRIDKELSASWQCYSHLQRQKPYENGVDIDIHLL